MKRKILLLIIFVFIVSIGFVSISGAETLSWNAVTTYTDGSTIPSATSKTYRAFWSTSSSLATLREMGSSSSSVSRTFNVNSEGMTRGTSVYFTVRATVNGVDSANATPLAWAVPSFAPSAPTNLRVN